MITAGDRSVRDSLVSAGRLRDLWTIVLAAGGSRRFGRNKLLMQIGSESLVARAARQATLVTGSRCVVVLGADAALLAARLRHVPVRVAINRCWRDGMAGSLQAGVMALPPSARAALVLLADQYAVGVEDIVRLARAWAPQPRRAVAALIGAQPGAPAVLPRSYFPRVMNLRGDEGARRLLRQAADAVCGIELHAAAFDLDDRQDLRQFRRLGHRAP